MKRTALLAYFVLALAACGEREDGAASRPQARFEWASVGDGPDSELRVRARALVDSIAAGRYGRVRSLFVAHGDTALVDTAFEPAARGIQPFFSIAKTVTAAVVGIAIDRGDLPSLTTPILTSLPDSLLPLATRNGWDRVSLEHLLTMTTGVVWDEVGSSIDEPRSDFQRLMASRDPVAFVIGRRITDVPGTTFRYCSGATLLLGRALERASGRNLADYARENLFAPLGIDSVTWLQLAGGTNAASGLSMRASDLARIGRLLALNGTWGGTEVLPRDWVAASWSAHADPSPDPGDFYGYGWFGLTLDSLPAARRDAPSRLRGRMLYGFGHRDQLLAVLPKRNLVVVVTANHRDDEYERLGTVRMVIERLAPLTDPSPPEPARSPSSR